MSFQEKLHYIYQNRAKPQDGQHEKLAHNLSKKLKYAASFENWKSTMSELDAILLIDIQKMFCDIKSRRVNKDTENTSKHISKLVPQFRALGVPIYSIFFSYDHKAPSEVDFYHYEYHKDDILIRKTDNSAFQGYGDSIETILKQNKHKKLLVMGFNAGACIHNTVVDAIERDFDIWVAPDCVGNDNDVASIYNSLTALAFEPSIKFIGASDALSSLKKHQFV
jgi:nicotinamidase-related amidase